MLGRCIAGARGLLMGCSGWLSGLPGNLLCVFGLVSLFYVLLSLFSKIIFFPIACDVEYLLGSCGWWWLWLWLCGGFHGCYG